jgi:flagellum-specific peptidoglycan hydrolase FlgJ
MADLNEYFRKTYGPKYQKKIDYFRKAAADAVVAGERLGMDPKLLLSQTALESGWGKSGLVVDANNFAGVKAKPGQPFVEAESAEGSGPTRRMQRSKFVAYESPSAFFDQWPEFLKAKRYQEAIKQKDPESYARMMGKAGYFTENPNKYAGMMKSIYRDVSKMMLDPNVVGERIMDSKIAGGMETR